MTCPACGSAVPADARFCPACGNPVATLPDERRIATVLFADLAGFTSLSEGSDPEWVKNLVDDCFERLASNITSFGGHVDKIVGDALVALFGAPVAHEDDPERAVRAALSLQASMQQFCESNSVEVGLRVGINTGEVLVGGIRAGDDYTAMGDVVNTASRLQTQAQPGQVLVGPATHDATRDVFEYEAIGNLEIRGRQEPVEAWVARGALTLPGRRTERRDVTIVGRDAEIALLRETMNASVARSRARLSLIIGEAGVGKSRLAREVTGPESISEVQSTILRTQCVPYGEADPWWPIEEAIREYVGIDNADGGRDKADRVVSDVLGPSVAEEETARITAGIWALVGHGESASHTDSAHAHDEVVRAIHTFLEALAKQKPLVLVLSDLHWADEVVLEFLDSVLSRLRNLPFVVMATARNEISDRWNPGARHETTVLHLDPLDERGTETLIRQHLGADTPAGVVDILLERSGGNPFFIEELAALASESDLDLVELAAQGAPEDRVRSMPATLRGLISARLDALDPDARDVLGDCAVAGSSATLDTLQALGSARGTKDVAPLARELTDRDLLHLDDSEYAFKSELIREIAYGTLTKAERAKRHAVLAGWYQDPTSHERESERLELQALHWGRAAQLSAEVGGIDALPEDTTLNAIRAHEEAAAHAERAEAWGRAEQHAEAAMGLSIASDPQHFERMRTLVRARVERHHLDQARGELDALLELAEASSSNAQRVEAFLVSGLFESRSMNYDAAIAAYDEAIALAEQLSHERSIAEGLRGRGMALMFRGDLDMAELAIQRAHGIFKDVRDKQGEAWALQNLAWISFYRGDSDTAEERVTTATKIFSEVQDWGGLDWALGLLAWIRFNQGRFDDAEELAARVLEHGGDAEDHWAMGMMHVLLSQIALWTGHPHLALDKGAVALTHFEAAGNTWGMMQSLVPRARAFTCLGRLADARATLASMGEVAADLGDDFLSILPQHVKVSIGCHVGDENWEANFDGIEPSTTHDGRALEEQNTMGALAALQAGQVKSARNVLEDVYKNASNESAAAAAGGLLALARVADGDAESAFNLTNDLNSLQVGSYLDKLQAWMARALAAAQLKRKTDSRGAADRAVELADATESPIDQALARLARAFVLDRLELPEAPASRAHALGQLERLGLTAPGWLVVFDLAANGAAKAAASS